MIYYGSISGAVFLLFVIFYFPYCLFILCHLAYFLVGITLNIFDLLAALLEQTRQDVLMDWQDKLTHAQVKLKADEDKLSAKRLFVLKKDETA